MLRFTFERLTAVSCIFLTLLITAVAWQIPLLSSGSPTDLPERIPVRLSPQVHRFTLRHLFHHGTSLYPDLHLRADVDTTASNWQDADCVSENVRSLRLQAVSRPINIERLSDRRMSTIEALLSANHSGFNPSSSAPAWVMDKVSAPDVTDKDTVINLAIMTANDYSQVPGTGDWEDVKDGYNYSKSFGWEDDGLRGHIFANQDNSTIVISIKGTSRAVFDIGGVQTNDKQNDNLLFSCCCAQGGPWLWRQACQCQTSAFTCNSVCLDQELRKNDRYWQAAREIYGAVIELYPESDVWLAGHSLGGAVAALVGLTYGVPTVAFEAPGDALPAARLGLPSPVDLPSYLMHRRNKNTGIYHFGHTADPIFTGNCNAAYSLCTLAGYSFESKCHTGMVCTYDTVNDKGWGVSLITHSIRYTIENVLRAYGTVANCTLDYECNECSDWKWTNSTNSTTTRTSTATSPLTSTSLTTTHTCETPGWWGCNDKITTTTTTTMTSTPTSTSTSTSSTVTCTDYGWFGNCRDPTTTTTAATATSIVSSSVPPSPAITL